MPIPEAYPYQRDTSRFILERDNSLILSDPGTGKTRCVLDAFQEHRRQYPDARLVVSCPKGIMKAAWGGDIRKFTPSLSVSFAEAKNRRDAFMGNDPIVVMNHEGVVKAQSWVNEYIGDHSWYAIDEFTWFKNPTAKRSKACFNFAAPFLKRTGMSGTPYGSTVCDIFTPMRIVDRGMTLGMNYYRFRNMVATPILDGPFKKWVDKPDAVQTLTTLLHDIAYRVSIDDVLAIPEMHHLFYDFELSPRMRRAYNELKEEAVALLDSGEEVTAVNAGVLAQKLLQVASGYIYVDDERVTIDHSRTEFALDIATEYDSALIVYQWKHQLEGLLDYAHRRGLRFGVISAEMNATERHDIVTQFQLGMIDYIFSHPLCLSHGYTLTRSATVIWVSPTSSFEQYHQLNARVYRNTQTRESQAIHIVGGDTRERNIYRTIQQRAATNAELLEIFAEQTRGSNA